MKPECFPEATVELKRPASMTDEECSSLHVFANGVECISRWRPSWRERLRVLFGAPVWLRVRSGNTQPPVIITTETPFGPPYATRAIGREK